MAGEVPAFQCWWEDFKWYIVYMNDTTHVHVHVSSCLSSTVHEVGCFGLICMYELAQPA